MLDSDLLQKLVTRVKRMLGGSGAESAGGSAAANAELELKLAPKEEELAAEKAKAVEQAKQLDEMRARLEELEAAAAAVPTKKWGGAQRIHPGP